MKLSEPVQLIIRSLRRFLSLSLILASMIFLVRVYEMFITVTVSHYPSGSFVNLLIGLKFDLILYLRISGTLMIPYLIIAYFNQRAAKRFFVIISITLIIFDILLVKYFSTARVPLGADLFGYTFDEILHTIGSSGKLSLIQPILIILFLLITIRVFIRHVYIKLKPWIMTLLTVLMLVSLLPVKLFRPNPSDFNREFSRFVACNKLDYFVNSVTHRYIQQELSDRKNYTIQSVKPSSSNRFNYVDPEFPFLHKETTPDDLAEYFNLGDTPPNIVLIIVESLGRAYSGDGAYLGSFTPFLDSLTHHSLYWENCLSTSGRTFQVLPALLASAPFGDHGFAALKETMPDHLSVMSMLKKQANYSATFVYGGESRFDAMDIFLRHQGIDQIIDSHNFGAHYSKMPASAKGFTWGYGDLDIFKRYLEELKTRPNARRLDVLLTLSMHDPFSINDQGLYLNMFNDRLKSLHLKEAEITFNRQYSKELTTVIYFDEALRYFFHEYSQSEAFNNTIFIITGDHRMPEIPISTQIDRFHVPLVIYSRLLKKPEKFSAIVSHFDVTPSLVALLDGEKYIRRPSVAPWIGHGLDLSVSFRSLHAYPFMRNTNEMLDFIDGEKFISNQTLYQVFPNLDIEPIEMPDTLQRIKTELADFMKRDRSACQDNKLIPDSIKIHVPIQ